MNATLSGDAAFRADLFGLGRRVGLAAPLLNEFLLLQPHPQRPAPPLAEEAEAEEGKGASDQAQDIKRKPRKDKGRTSDADPSFAQGYAEQLHMLRARRDAYREAHRLLLRSLRGAAQAVSEESHRLIDDVRACEEVRCLGALADIVSQGEAALARASVQYFAVLLAERNAHLESLRAELERLEATRRHAELHGRMQLFARTAALETAGRVQVSFLGAEDGQYQRCKRAVKDNTAPNIFDNAFFEGIKVLHVMSVKHSILLDRIQAHSQRLGRAAKTKGLFCCLGGEDVFGFLAFGLYRQGQQQQETAPLRPFIPAWYSRPIPASSNASSASSSSSSSSDPPGTGQRQNSRGGGASAAAAAASTAADPGRPGEGIAAGMAGAQRAHPCLRFSRRVSLGLLTRRQEFSHASVRTGCEQDLPFLALCRVLLHRVHDVSAASACDADIEEAIRLGCDAVHATESDEYVLLNPDYVLPEFLIHVQLEWSAPPEDAALRPGCTASGEPLPAPPGMLPVASRRNCPPVLHIASTSVGRGEGGLESEASRRSRPLRPPLGSQLPEEEEGQEGEEGSAGCFLSSAVSASYFAPSSMSLQAALGGSSASPSSSGSGSPAQLLMASRKQALLRGLELGVRAAEEQARAALEQHLRDVRAMLSPAASEE